jgi:hypothetical protein
MHIHLMYDCYYYCTGSVPKEYAYTHNANSEHLYRTNKMCYKNSLMRRNMGSDQHVLLHLIQQLV